MYQLSINEVAINEYVFYQLSDILQKIQIRCLKNEMPCFKQEDVIFLTNKWDTIKSDENMHDEKTVIWEKTKMKIKQTWPFVKEEKIFRLNLKDVNINLK